MSFNFKPVAKEDVPDVLKKSVAAVSSDNETDEVVEIPDDDGYFIIVDDTGQEVGRLNYPRVVCPGLGCKGAVGKRHPFSFRHDDKHDRWVHTHCGRPTQLAWEAGWNSMVQFNTEKFGTPWEVGPHE